MKKLFCFVVMLTMAVSLFVVCGCSKKDVPVQDAPDKNAPVTEPEKPAISENKEVVTAEEAPEVVIIMGAEEGVDNMTYHLKDCKTLKGKTTQDISWEIVKTVGFWQCPECNPPRYEDYKNAE